MHDIQAGDPALTIAIALAVGTLAQSVAHHIRIPGIVLLLAAGVLLGPDVANIVRPGDIGDALPTIVGFSVAIILFEGGLNLQFRRLKEEAAPIRRLVTLGALTTTIGAALFAHFLMGWHWREAALFGTLVIVTGPTVITPILRRIRVSRSVHTVLEAEGILIDAVGAVTAVLALEIAISPTTQSIAESLLDFAQRFGIGVALGVSGGLVIVYLLRMRRVVPEGLENIFTLSLALAIFQISNALLAESGIVAVILAGMMVGNMRTHVQRDLLEFKEQLTVLLIGMLFVLLAADIRVDDVRALGKEGVLTVLGVMLVVRPVTVAACTVGSSLKLREKAFIAWLGPRGIVAAAVASLVADALERSGIEGGRELRALVFLVIAGTVLIQGLSGGPVASLLGVRRRMGRGYAILGANALCRAVGNCLRELGEEVTFLEANHEMSHAAQEEHFRVLFGNALEERTMLRAELDTLAGCIGGTSNDEVNFIFCRKARQEYKAPRAYVALGRGQDSITKDLVEDAGASVLFGGRRDLELWSVRMRRGFAGVERWKWAKRGEDPQDPIGSDMARDGVFLPLVKVRSGPIDNRTKLGQGDEVFFAIYQDRAEEAHAWLLNQGWELLTKTEAPAPA